MNLRRCAEWGNSNTSVTLLVFRTFSFKISAVTKHVETENTWIFRSLFPLLSPAAEASWRFRGRELKIPSFVPTVNQTLTGAYLPLTHLSYWAEDHQWQPLVLIWWTFPRAASVDSHTLLLETLFSAFHLQRFPSFKSVMFYYFSFEILAFWIFWSIFSGCYLTPLSRYVSNYV